MVGGASSAMALALLLSAVVATVFVSCFGSVCCAAG